MDIIIRPTRVEKANLGEHLMRNEDDVKRIMTVEAMPNRPVEISEEDNSPVDPLEYFAISKSNTADKALKPAFRLLNSDELITNKNAYRFSKYAFWLGKGAPTLPFYMRRSAKKASNCPKTASFPFHVLPESIQVQSTSTDGLFVLAIFS